jgi:hypothetical protein
MTHTYGLEFEVIGLTPRESAHAVTRAGITCESQDYNHATASVWKAVRDGSLPDGSSEIVSPILEPSRLNEMKTVTRALLNAGARVTRSAGFHAHFGFDRIGKDGVANLVMNWEAMHDFTDLLVAPSRRLNGASYRWCQRFSAERAESWAERIRDERLDFGSLDRYYSLNLASVARHGTVEFRLHQGTLNGAKASAWVEYLTAFVNHSMEGSAWNRAGNADLDSLNTMLGVLGNYGLTNATREYLLARAGDLGERA